MSRPTHRQSTARHGCTIAVAVACAATLFGCGSPAKGPQGSPASGTTSTAPQRSTRATLPGTQGDRLLRNSSTIYAGCDPAVQPNALQTGQIFDTQTGDNIALPHPAIAAGEKLMAQGCAVATTNDGKQRVIYLLTTKTPSQGLTPESQQTNLIAFDPSNPQPTAKSRFRHRLPETKSTQTGRFIQPLASSWSPTGRDPICSRLRSSTPIRLRRRRTSRSHRTPTPASGESTTTVTPCRTPSKGPPTPLSVCISTVAPTGPKSAHSATSATSSRQIMASYSNTTCKPLPRPEHPSTRRILRLVSSISTYGHGTSPVPSRPTST